MTTTTAEPDTQTTQTDTADLPDLTGHDRCDNSGCNAAAYVRVALSAGDLVFCGHHYSNHETALATAGATIRDERKRLTVSYVDVEATELG